jgi:hypothetical protein
MIALVAIIAFVGGVTSTKKRESPGSGKQGMKANLNGPLDLGAVGFHERRAAALQKVAAIETPLFEIVVRKRRRKPSLVAVSENGVTAKA